MAPVLWPRCRPAQLRAFALESSAQLWLAVVAFVVVHLGACYCLRAAGFGFSLVVEYVGVFGLVSEWLVVNGLLWFELRFRFAGQKRCANLAKY